jgi:hypothetical protein
MSHVTDAMGHGATREFTEYGDRVAAPSKAYGDLDAAAAAFKQAAARLDGVRSDLREAASAAPGEDRGDIAAVQVAVGRDLSDDADVLLTHRMPDLLYPQGPAAARDAEALTAAIDALDRLAAAPAAGATDGAARLSRSTA